MTSFADPATSASADARALVEAYIAAAAKDGSPAAVRALCARMPTDSPRLWLDCAERMIDADCPLSAVELLRAATTHFPDSVDVHCRLASALWHADQAESAESLLRDVIAALPAHLDAAKQLALLLRGQGRMDAAAAVMEAAHARLENGDERLDCVRFIASCQRQHRAAALIEREVAGGMRDPAALFIAGNLAQEIGRFDGARAHFLAASREGVDQNIWFAAASLAYTQRYVAADHADFALFKNLLRQPQLIGRGRAAVLFALAKAYDDIGDYAGATPLLRQANSIVRSEVKWSRATWHERVEATLARPWRAATPGPASAWTPIFVVGLPRSGTTLLAEFIGRHPQACNRGEMPTLPFLAEGLSAIQDPCDEAAIDEARTLYSKHLRQDDAPARAYVDKNPLNFRYLGLAASMFPSARIIYCQRDIRDTALSLWSYLFAHPDYAFTYDLNDIATVAADCHRLMTYWKRVLPLAVLDVSYEDLVKKPASSMKRIFNYVGLADFDPLAETSRKPSAIASTSRWQARQPIYQRSVERWKRYSAWLPELDTVFASVGTEAQTVHL